VRAVWFDGRKDVCLDVPKWVSIRAESDQSLVAVCSRCEMVERVSIACGSAMRRHEAERNLGRFVLRHDACTERVKFRVRRVAGKGEGPKLILVGNRYVRRA